MVKERINYSEKPKKYERLLDIFMKRIEITTSIQIQVVLLFAGFIIPLAAYMLSWILPSFFDNLTLLIARYSGILKTILVYVSSPDIANKIAGAIIFLFSSSIMLFGVLIIILEILFFYKIKDWVGEKIAKHMGVNELEATTNAMHQLGLAKYEPENWDLIIDVDRDDKRIYFQRIEKTTILNLG